MTQPQHHVSNSGLEGYQHIKDHYLDVRRFSEKLCQPLATEDYGIQTMPDVSPAKWHLAHTTWFFETFLLKPHLSGYQPFNEQFEYLFNSYYNAIGRQFPRAQRGTLSRPVVEDVYRYRSHVDQQMLSLIDTISCDDKHKLFHITVGLHHEQQHQELILTDLKHGLGANPLFPVYDSQAIKRDSLDTISHTPKMRYIEKQHGLYTIGYQGEQFAFDNESPRHPVHLSGFRFANRLVTCGEYIEFIEDGGYQSADLWLSDAWACINKDPSSWQLPLYWQQRDGEYFYFTLSGLQPVNLLEPVCHVSFYEADAYARWAGKRLPTEAEWEVVCSDGEDKFMPLANFVDNKRFHPRPIKQASANDQNIVQLMGDVWEWTQSSYSPYPGYQPFPGALAEYNGKFMCSQLVLRGGSCATSATHIRPTYRNFFFPCDRWQFSGIRLAQSL